MKGVMQMLIFILVLLVCVPLVIGLAAWDSSETYLAENSENPIELPKKIKVWMEDEQKVKKVNFEEYVSCVVASEMPGSFEPEALKAQSVAARTYAAAKVLAYESQGQDAHPEAPVCNTTHCQVYKTEKQLIECHDKGWEDEQWHKIQKACHKTQGELMYYGGELVKQPLFFSSSGGQTENAEDVFANECPYLVSVSSPYEDGATHTNEKKSFTLQEVESLLNDAYSDRTTGKLTNSNIKIISRTAGGRVDKMQVGQSTYRGTEVRSALGLSSALFSTAFEGSGSDLRLVFTSNGSGHGVGMSQYGANGMAKEGKNYKEIISHYYTGVEVQ